MVPYCRVAACLLRDDARPDRWPAYPSLPGGSRGTVEPARARRQRALVQVGRREFNAAVVAADDRALTRARVRIEAAEAPGFVIDPSRLEPATVGAARLGRPAIAPLPVASALNAERRLFDDGHLNQNATARARSRGYGLLR